MKKKHYAILTCIAIVLVVLYLTNTSSEKECHVEMVNEIVACERDNGASEKALRVKPTLEQEETTPQKDKGELQRLEELARDEFFAKIRCAQQRYFGRIMDSETNGVAYFTPSREEAREADVLNEIHKMMYMLAVFPQPSEYDDLMRCVRLLVEIDGDEVRLPPDTKEFQQLTKMLFDCIVGEHRLPPETMTAATKNELYQRIKTNEFLQSLERKHNEERP